MVDTLQTFQPNLYIIPNASYTLLLAPNRFINMIQCIAEPVTASSETFEVVHQGPQFVEQGR
jgi:hypothetical protein